MKDEKKSFLPPPNSKETKIEPLVVHDSPYPLPACIFRFQHCFSPGLIAGAEIERARKTIKSPPPPAECMFTLPFGCMKSLFQKLFVIVFCLVRISPGRKIPVFRREHFLQSSWTLTFSFWAARREGFLVFTPLVFTPCVPISFQTVPDGTSV